MIENNPEQLDPMQLRDRILENVVLDDEFSKEDFTYNDTLYGLTVPGSQPETFRLAFFRAVSVDSGELVNRPAERANSTNAQFGTGLYGGNSVESVAHFAWSGNRTIRLFLTPEISKDQIVDDTYGDDEKIKELKDLAKIKVGTLHRATGKTNETMLQQRYGDASLVILDKPLDVKLSQRLQAGRQEYPIKPFWYLWRSEGNEGFEEVGEATYFPKQRRIAKIAVDSIMGSPNP